MNNLVGCLFCYVSRFFAVYVAFGLLFGVGAVIVAAFIAWPYGTLVFAGGLLSGLIFMLVLRRLVARLPDVSKVLSHLHAGHAG